MTDNNKWRFPLKKYKEKKSGVGLGTSFPCNDHQDSSGRRKGYFDHFYLKGLAGNELYKALSRFKITLATCESDWFVEGWSPVFTYALVVFLGHACTRAGVVLWTLQQC